MQGRIHPVGDPGGRRSHHERPDERGEQEQQTVRSGGSRGDDGRVEDPQGRRSPAASLLLELRLLITLAQRVVQVARRLVVARDGLQAALPAGHGFEAPDAFGDLGA